MNSLYTNIRFLKQTVGVYWPADNQVIKHGVFQVACKESKTTSSYTVKTLSVKRKVGVNLLSHFLLFI